MRLVLHLEGESPLDAEVFDLVGSLFGHRDGAELLVLLAAADPLSVRSALAEVVPAGCIVACPVPANDGTVDNKSPATVARWAMARALRPDAVLHLGHAGAREPLPPDRGFVGHRSALLILTDGETDPRLDPRSVGHSAVLVLDTRSEAAALGAGLPTIRVKRPLGPAVWGWVRAAPQRPGPVTRRSLALVSPWPPARTGVADFAAVTVANLAESYDVTIVGEDTEDVLPFPRVRRREFLDTWWRYDRVLYHLGNSTYHSVDLDLMAKAPGAVVVHDAVLSGAISGTSDALGHPGGFGTLLAEDGPMPPRDQLDLRGARAVLAPALGALVHSDHARDLLRAAGVTIPVLHVARHPVQCPEAAHVSRRPVDGQAVIAHFGFVNPHKGAEVLVRAAAELAASGVNCILVFVGEFSGVGLLTRTRRLAADLGVSLTVTGFIEQAAWESWLARVSCAVQLREQSHGESSGALARLLAAGVPVVCTDIGSFAELPEGVVRHVPSGVEPAQLASVVREVLDPTENTRLAAAGEIFARTDLSVGAWSDATARMVEDAYSSSLAVQSAEAASGFQSIDVPGISTFALRGSSGRGHAAWVTDVSVYAGTTFFSGVQRVAARLHDELAREVHPHVTLHPTRITEGLPDRPHPEIGRDSMTWRPSVPLAEAEWLLCIDLNVRLARHKAELVAARRAGLRVAAFVHDLMPVLHPEWFPPERGEVGFDPWLRTMLDTADLLLAVSSATASDVKEFVNRNPPTRSDVLELGVLPLGWDFLPRERPPTPEATAAPERAPDHFLMVGTIEPRKGHRHVLDAFEELWRAGSSARLTAVGRRGWTVDDLVRRLSRLNRDEQRLCWLDNASDAQLDDLYATCTAVVMASEGEGFGLPIVEAALHGCPVVVRDIPVLREVAGDSATYFQGDASDLGAVLSDVMTRARSGPLPVCPPSSFRSWRQVARDLAGLLRDEQRPTARWSPSTREWTAR